jgi:hypothetical protein
MCVCVCVGGRREEGEGRGVEGGVVVVVCDMVEYAGMPDAKSVNAFSPITQSISTLPTTNYP